MGKPFGKITQICAQKKEKESAKKWICTCCYNHAKDKDQMEKKLLTLFVMSFTVIISTEVFLFDLKFLKVDTTPGIDSYSNIPGTANRKRC